VFAQVFGGGAAARVPLTEAISARPAAALDLHQRELSGATFHGDGALRYRAQILAALGSSAQVIDRTAPLAGAIGRIAASHPDRAVLPHAIVPIYVRRPDAEIARDRRSGRA
jgi:hypothetical protein